LKTGKLLIFVACSSCRSCADIGKLRELARKFRQACAVNRNSG